MNVCLPGVVYAKHGVESTDCRQIRDYESNGSSLEVYRVNDHLTYQILLEDEVAQHNEQLPHDLVHSEYFSSNLQRESISSIRIRLNTNSNNRQ